MIQQTYSRNLATIMLLQTSIFEKIRNITKMSFFKQDVNASLRIRIDGGFLGLAGLFLGISLGLRHREIPRSSPASPWKTPSIPPLLLGLTHSWFTLTVRLEPRKHRCKEVELPNQPTMVHYIILNNGILKSNSSVFHRSEGYILQYTLQGVYGLIVYQPTLLK